MRYAIYGSALAALAVSVLGNEVKAPLPVAEKVVAPGVFHHVQVPGTIPVHAPAPAPVPAPPTPAPAKVEHHEKKAEEHKKHHVVHTVQVKKHGESQQQKLISELDSLLGIKSHRHGKHDKDRPIFLAMLQVPEDSLPVRKHHHHHHKHKHHHHGKFWRHKHHKHKHHRHRKGKKDTLCKHKRLVKYMERELRKQLGELGAKASLSDIEALLEAEHLLDGLDDDSEPVAKKDPFRREYWDEILDTPTEARGDLWRWYD